MKGKTLGFSELFHRMSWPHTLLIQIKVPKNQHPKNSFGLYNAQLARPPFEEGNTNFTTDTQNFFFTMYRKTKPRS
jgi:hypothetical protein